MTRKEFNKRIIISNIIGLVLVGIDYTHNLPVGAFFSLLMIIPYIYWVTKRLKTLQLNKWYLFLLLIPFVSIGFLIYLMVKKDPVIIMEQPSVFDIHIPKLENSPSDGVHNEFAGRIISHPEDLNEMLQDEVKDLTNPKKDE